MIYTNNGNDYNSIFNILESFIVKKFTNNSIYSIECVLIIDLQATTIIKENEILFFDKLYTTALTNDEKSFSFKNVDNNDFTYKSNPTIISRGVITYTPNTTFNYIFVRNVIENTFDNINGLAYKITFKEPLI